MKNFLAAVLLIFGSLLFMSTIHAEVVTIEADGYYIVGLGPPEDPKVARARARADAKRAALEKAASILWKFSRNKTKDDKFDDDKVKTVISASMQIKKEIFTIEPLKELGDEVFQYHCHIEALIDADKIARRNT